MNTGPLSPELLHKMDAYWRPGSNCPTQNALDEVVDATLACVLRAVLAAVPGVAFLPGGQSADPAPARLNA
jgi:fructose-bisphosphate aldolase class I